MPAKDVAGAGEVAVELEMKGSIQDVDQAAASQDVGRDRLGGGVERHHDSGDRGDEPPLGVLGCRFWHTDASSRGKESAQARRGSYCIPLPLGGRPTA